MSMPKRLSLLLLSISLFFTSACGDEAQLAEQCETQSSCETTTETKTNWASAGGIGAGVLALGALAGGGGGSSSSNGGSTSSGSSTETTDTTNTTDSSSTNSSSSSDANTDNKTAFTMKPTTEFCEDVCDGLVAYYPFFGNTNDNSDNSLNSKLLGTEFNPDRDNIPNQSLHFQTPFDHLFIDSLAESNLVTESFTVVVIVKLEDFNENQINGIFSGNAKQSFPDRSSDSFMFEVQFELNQENKQQLSFLYLENNKVSSTNLNPFEYNHIVGVFNDEKDNIFLYVNGQLIAANIVTDPHRPTLDQLRIGMVRNLDSPGGSGRDMNGWVDEARIYNRALSESEIQQIVGIE